MNKVEFDGWMSMPGTKEFFELVAKRQQEQNQDFLLGTLRNDNNDLAMKYYDQIIGYNKAIYDLAHMDYYNLTGTPEPQNDEEENDANKGREESSGIN